MTLIDQDTLVCIHLNELEKLVSRNEPSPGDAIHASIVLRVLNDDNLLGKVGQNHDLQILVSAPKLDESWLDQALFFVCGGHRYGNRDIARLCKFREPGSASPHRPQYEDLVANLNGSQERIEMKLGQFWEEPSLSACGTTVSRNRIIRYVANRCGGAHYSNSTDRFEVKKLEPLITEIGMAFHLEGNGLSVVFAEIIGTAWYLITSPSIQVLRERLSRTDSTHQYTP